jgi:hypothetical protein
MDGTQGQYKYFSVVYFVFPEGSEWPLHKSKGPRVNFYLCDRFLTFVYFTWKSDPVEMFQNVDL